MVGLELVRGQIPGPPSHPHSQVADRSQKPPPQLDPDEPESHDEDEDDELPLSEDEQLELDPPEPVGPYVYPIAVSDQLTVVRDDSRRVVCSVRFTGAFNRSL